MSDMANERPITEDDFARDFAPELHAWLTGDSTADTAEAPAETTTAEDTGADTGDAARDPVVDETGRHHDPETGKFVEKPEGETDEETEETEETEEETPAEEADDDDFVIEVDDEETAQKVATLLEKYDGDVAKALIAATEAQSLIGRKGNEAAQAKAELDEVRQQLAELKAMQTQTQSLLAQPRIPITHDLIVQDPRAAAEQAVLQDNPQALEAAIYAWREGTEYADANPVAAQLFLEKLALQAAQQAQQPAAQETAPAASTDAQTDAEVAKVLERHPDLEQYLPAIAAVANERPLLRSALESGTPAERAQALEDLTVIAKSRQSADTSREALKRVQIRVKQEADDERKNARVVSASRGSAAAASQPTRVDTFLDAFDARLGLKRDEN